MCDVFRSSGKKCRYCLCPHTSHSLSNLLELEFEIFKLDPLFGGPVMGSLANFCINLRGEGMNVARQIAYMTPAQFWWKFTFRTYDGMDIESSTAAQDVEAIPPRIEAMWSVSSLL